LETSFLFVIVPIMQTMCQTFYSCQKSHIYWRENRY